MRTFTDTEITAAARTAHNVNRAYCTGVGDISQPLWMDAPSWQKVSAADGVRAIIADPSMTAEQSHERWLKHKLEDGWKYGVKKDPDKKEHPCCVAYAKLPPHQRHKDTLFGATVRGVLGL